MAAEASSGKLRKGAIDVDEMLKNLSEAEKECVFLAKALRQLDTLAPSQHEHVKCRCYRCLAPLSPSPTAGSRGTCHFQVDPIRQLHLPALAPGWEPPAPPSDFRCPITLDIMHEPVVVASGQTYDRESISRWFGSGKSTCPKTGQVLTVLELVPNKALKNLIAKWCRENDVAMESSEASKSELVQAVATNKAVLEATRMTASFLVKKLSICFFPDAANRVVHEIRLLSKSGVDSHAFVGEAGAVPLLYSEDIGLQLNAVMALLNLSILEANKKRIMHADGAVEAVAHIMSSGATWCAKENAAAIVLSLVSVHTYRRRLGQNLSVVRAQPGVRTHLPSHPGAGARRRS
ncbi:U-box domain-containing protein 16-like [Miscanthus floridulus]|uniref:U-box domain-containing protein 16-like n=1 Tax=Miscanthus floridulus TaxID=154761 RepID=UPI0034580C90